MKIHLNLATRDLDASVAFYRTLLLTETEERDNEATSCRTTESPVAAV